MLNQRVCQLSLLSPIYALIGRYWYLPQEAEKYIGRSLFLDICRVSAILSSLSGKYCSKMHTLSFPVCDNFFSTRLTKANMLYYPVQYRSKHAYRKQNMSLIMILFSFSFVTSCKKPFGKVTGNPLNNRNEINDRT